MRNLGINDLLLHLMTVTTTAPPLSRRVSSLRMILIILRTLPGMRGVLRYARPSSQWPLALLLGLRSNCGPLARARKR